MRRINWHLIKKKISKKKVITNLIFSLALFSPSITLFANPHHPAVVSGKVEFSKVSPSALHIKTSDKAIINWGGFSVGKGELTKFIQPNSSSAVLNRVTSSEFSKILGNIESNGNIYLINPNGILVADGAIINTAGFLASTLDVNNDDFLKGNDLLFSGNSHAAITNLGTIKSSAGDVVLIGYQVDNQGSIIASEGAARLFAGSEMLLQVNGDERIIIKPNSKVQQKEGTALNNSGTIEAVVAELKADGNPYLFAINHEGSINATGLVTQNGQVYLKADNGRTSVAGSIKAINSNEIGGEVTILGKEIGVWDTSVIDISGDNGGGSLYLGGGFQGKDPNLMNASQVIVQPEAKVIADANINGDGGKVISWSDDAMYHYGNISAKGGQQSGDGGFVEVSGKRFLDYQGTSNLTASNGQWGTLLLDPTNLFIQTPSSASPILHSPTPFYPGVPGTPANIAPSTIETNLLLGNVVIQTGNDGGAGSGDITWIESIQTNPGNHANLTIQSANNIIITNSSSGTVGGYVNTSSSGDLNLYAQNNIIFSTSSTLDDPFLFNVNGNINMMAINGDININGVNSPGSFFSSKDINVTSENGSFLITGSSRTNSPINYIDISAVNGAISINTALDCLFTAGSGLSAGIYLFSDRLNMNVGGSARFIATNTNSKIQLNAVNGINASFIKDLILQGGFESDSFSTINCNNGTLDLDIGQDLYINGGSGNGSFAAINFASPSVTNLADIMISVGRDLVMQGGTADNSFAQIGSIGYSPNINDVQSAWGNANITISKVGRDAILSASSSFVTNAYAAIGHGNFNSNGLGNTLSGNIIFNGTPTSSLTLNGGFSFNQTFAQIGHFEGTFATGQSTIEGNVNVCNFGSNINLNPLGSYAAIGHGYSQTTPYPSITGDITVSNNSGNINLNATTLFNSIPNNTFSQIGHFSANTIIGNISVDTTGNMNLTAGGFSNTKAIIGHGNFFSVNSAFYSSKILASANTIFLNAGNSVSGNIDSANAVIGFEPGKNGNLTHSALIDPSSTITVTAQNDITLNGGFSFPLGFLSSGGNAIIGFQESNATATTTIENISVTSLNGDITLNGGYSLLLLSGKSLIGVSQPSAGTFPPFALQANVNVDAPNGTLNLYGTPQIANSLASGIAQISTGSSFNPFDLNIEAKNLRLFGANGLNAGNGIAVINSSRNMNLKITGDVNLTANTGTARIVPGVGTLTASIEGSLTLNGGINANTIAQIGNNLPNIGSTPIIIEQIGGNLDLNGGTGQSAIAVIGNGFGQLEGISFADITFGSIKGNVTLKGGTELFSTAAIGNGVAFDGTSIAGNITFETIGGNLNLIAGSGRATIGHGADINLGTVQNISGNINFGKIGANVQLNSNSINSGGFTTIGHAAFRAPSTIPEISTLSGNINFGTIGSDLTLLGGSNSNQTAIIGHGIGTNTISLLGNIQFAEIGGNVTLQGGNGTNCFAHIGQPSSSNQTFASTTGDIRFDLIKGSVNLIGGDGPQTRAYIGLGTPISNTKSRLNGQVIVHANSVNLKGGSNITTDALIGFLEAPIVNSSLVEVISNGPITLAAGDRSNTTIGYNTENLTTQLNIDTIHVVSDANIALIGGSSFRNNGGVALIGTLSSSAQSNLNSSIKITTPFDLVLKNTSTGQAVVSNNIFQVSNGKTVTIDPARIILLGGTSSSNRSGSTIYSSGNLELNFEDALHINYNADSPNILQASQAIVAADGDILINTNKESFGEIFIQGINNNFQSAISTITSFSGNVQIGSVDHSGAGNIDIYAPSNRGIANIQTFKGKVSAFFDGDLTIATIDDANSLTPQASIKSENDLTIHAGGDISLAGSDRPVVDNFQNVKIINNMGDTSIFAGGSLNIGTQSAIQTSLNGGNGKFNVDVAYDLKMLVTDESLLSGAIVKNFGSGTSTFTIGQDLAMHSDASIENVLNGDLIFNVGQDVSLTDISNIKNLGSGNIKMNVGRDILLSTSGNISSLGFSQVNLNAGRLFSMSDFSLINHNSSGDLEIHTENAVISGFSKLNVTGSGDLYVIADRNINLNDASTVSTNGGNLTLVVDNSNPFPPLFGNGKFHLGSEATINSQGGALRIFTSRRAFNTIDGFLNGQHFQPNVEFFNTDTEQWGKYFETAILGHPYTLFYKDTGVPHFPPHINPNVIHRFNIATSEALQEWRTLDELYLIPDQLCAFGSFCEEILPECLDEGCPGLTKECWISFTRELVTYNTKKLFDITYH